MTINLQILIILYVLTALVLIVFSVINLTRNSKQTVPFDLQELTVIVPFRNEERSITKLLESLIKQDEFPYQYVFINDHSSDAGEEQIHRMLENQPIHYRLIHLPKTLQGKKSAIRFAMQFVETEFFLLQDADVQLPLTYFHALRALPEADLYILPVAMKSKRVPQLFYSLDHFMINAVNWSVSAVYPLTASGANLLVRKSCFMALTFKDYKEAFASGDDQFILRDFRIANKKISTFGTTPYTVSTHAPKTFKEFIDQRVRWAGKTAKVGDVLDVFIASLSLLYAFSFFIFSIAYLFNQQFLLASIVFCIKLGLDSIFYSFYFIQQKRPLYLFLLPFMNIIFPIYALLIAVLVPFYKPKWKGREIYAAQKIKKV